MQSLNHHDQFTYELYKQLLETALSCGEVLLFSKRTTKPGLIIRHDVDLDLKLCEHMVIVEKRLGVRSTFYVMVRSPLYNPLAPNESEFLRWLIAEGFEVGLHFDPVPHEQLIGQNHLNYKRCILEDASILSTVFNSLGHTHVRSVSFHNCGTRAFSQNLVFAADGADLVLENAWFDSGRYISDSRMQLPMENVFAFVEHCGQEQLMLNIHPEHWIHGPNNTYENIIFKHSVNSGKDIREVLSVNSTYLSGLH